MEKEQKLLLKDLSARLPYGVKVYGNYRYDDGDKIVDDEKIEVLDLSKLDWFLNGIDIKPYLRSLSSMTKEEMEYLRSRWGTDFWDDDDVYKYFNNHYIAVENTYYFIDWLNANHFDYRGLIKKGLALEAPEGMYK